MRLGPRPRSVESRDRCREVRTPSAPTRLRRVRGIYWTAFDGVLRRSDPDGTGITNVVAGMGDPLGIAVAGDRLYWANHSRGTIQAANADGTGVRDVVTGLRSPEGVAVVASKLYWTDPVAGKIQVANLDGTRAADLITGLRRPTGIAVAGGKVYWTDNYAGKIQVANPDGSGVQVLVTGLRSPCRGLRLPGARCTGQKTTQRESGLRTWTGPGLRTWLPGPGGTRSRRDRTRYKNTSPAPVLRYEGIAVAGSKVYWTQHHPARVRVADTDGLRGNGLGCTASAWRACGRRRPRVLDRPLFRKDPGCQPGRVPVSPTWLPDWTALQE